MANAPAAEVELVDLVVVADGAGQTLNDATRVITDARNTFNAAEAVFAGQVQQLVNQLGGHLRTANQLTLQQRGELVGLRQQLLHNLALVDTERERVAYLRGIRPNDDATMQRRLTSLFNIMKGDLFHLAATTREGLVSFLVFLVKCGCEIAISVIEPYTADKKKRLHLQLPGIFLAALIVLLTFIEVGMSIKKRLCWPPKYRRVPWMPDVFSVLTATSVLILWGISTDNPKVLHVSYFVCVFQFVLLIDKLFKVFTRKQRAYEFYQPRV